MADLAKIDALSTVIHGIPLPPAVQAHIDSLNILRAVRGTTGIEGTEVSEAEVQEIIRAPQRQVLSDARHRAELEVRNAEHVMRFVPWAVKQEPHYPVTEHLICEIHRLTTEGIDYPNNQPGMYRSHSVTVGTYVPPREYHDVRRLMAEFVDWFNGGPPRGWHPAVRAVAAHFYLISIHPFGDGNGRTARGLESYLLYQGGINARGFYSLANYYYQRRPEYVAMLDHVRFDTNGDITPFIQFALDGLVTEQEAVHREILAEVTIMAFRDFARAQLTQDGKLGTKAGQRMFHFLLGLPGDAVSIRELRMGGHPLSQLYHGVGAKTLSRDLNYLSEKELIKIDAGQIRANVQIMQEFM
ncbi:MAG: Fic family protein [Dehalococcoidia bacterium]